MMLVLTMEDLYDDDMWDYSLGREYSKQHMSVLSLARFDPAFWRHVNIPSESSKDRNENYIDM